MHRPLLIVVEGANDITFLVRLSTRLRAELPHLPDLQQLQSEWQIALLPIGGGDPATWPYRMQALGCPEFHLYDREQHPETDSRRRAIAAVNARPGCRGFLTSKRALENYLHPQAIAAGGGGELSFGDHDAVSLLLARSWFEVSSVANPWDTLPRRTQRRLSGRAKRWLNTIAVDQMTAPLLAEHDPAGEIVGWLTTIAEMVRRGSASAVTVA